MLAVASRLGPYEIVAPLGAGGMGEVYRARDTRLGREVAVKVLPEPFAADPDRLARFEREARAVAALSHPNILAIHDYGAHEAVTYAVMELLEGETLRDRLKKGPLKWRESVEVGAAIADGLAAAHAKNIVHRDLKPENLFLTSDGRVKILDFGLARMDPTPVAGADTGPYIPAETDPGTVLGTVGYMSPEQVRGQPVDARTDIFSLGCVLYEMVTGRRPFTRPTRADVLSAVLRDEPPSLADAGLPAELDRTIRHCLKKDAGKRFQSAHDLAFALREIRSELSTPLRPRRPWRRRLALGGGAVFCIALLLGALVFRPWTHPPGPAPEPDPKPGFSSVAVLPFKNVSAGPDDSEHLADGITESLITRLTQLPSPGLRVTPWMTAERYKKSAKTLPEIAAEMRVEALIIGTLRKSGDRLHVTVAIIEASTAFQIWAEEFDEPLTDILLVQRHIAVGVATKLKGQLTGRQEETVARTSSHSAEAYEYYLRGKAALRQGGKESNRLALELFQKAVKIDARLPEALTGVGEAHYNQYYYGWQGEERNLQEAEASFVQALRLNPGLASAHRGLARVHWIRGKSEDCLKQGQLAARHGREDPETLLARADAYHFGGLRDKPVALYQKIIELDPANLEAHYTLAEIYVYLGRFREAIAASEVFLRKFGDVSPGHAHLFIGTAYHCLGDSEKAKDSYEKAIATAPEDWQTYRRLGVLQKQTGQEEEAKKTWERGRQIVIRRLNAYPENSRIRGHLAIFSGYLGDRDTLTNEETGLLKGVPDNGLLLMILGHARAALGDTDRAVEFYDRGLRLGLVDFEEEHFLKAEGLERLNDHPAFQKYMKEYHDARSRLHTTY